MKLLYVHERFGSLGGAEANALITARELKGRGHTVGLAHGPSTGKASENWNCVFENRFDLDRATSKAAAIQEAVQDFAPDVVYVHKMADLDVIETLVLSGKPLVRMVHDHDIYCMRSYKYHYLSRKICARPASAYCVFPCGASVTKSQKGGFPLQFNSLSEKRREIALNHRFDRMLVVTEFMREELLKNGFEDRKIEIHPPVPLAVDSGIRSNFSGRNLIIYAGQIIRGKGVDVLLESLALVKVPFECIILGDGNHKPHCEELCQRLGLADRVKFKGFVPQEELKNYYRECSVIAISSVWPEPIATIGLEVMRYALPVVAFDAGGIKDWLRDGVNGFLVKWMDRSAYAGAIEKLLLDKTLARQMGERGLDLVSQKYNFDTYIEGLEDLFSRVITSSRSRVGAEAGQHV